MSGEPLAPREDPSMIRTLLVTSLLVPLAFVPTALAHDCPPADPVLLDVGGVYVTDAPGVFQESNDVAGLQSAAGSCEDDNGRLVVWDADTRLA
jgi:hypothetical protein